MQIGLLLALCAAYVLTLRRVKPGLLKREADALWLAAVTILVSTLPTPLLAIISAS